MTETRLTPAQAKALAVLAAHPDEEIQGWRERTVEVGDSTLRGAEAGVPRLNIRSALSLVDRGLARCHPTWRGGVTTHEDRYTVTDAGRALHDERIT